MMKIKSGAIIEELNFKELKTFKTIESGIFKKLKKRLFYRSPYWPGGADGESGTFGF